MFTEKKHTYKIQVCRWYYKQTKIVHMTVAYKYATKNMLHVLCSRFVERNKCLSGKRTYVCLYICVWAYFFIILQFVLQFMAGLLFFFLLLLLLYTTGSYTENNCKPKEVCILPFTFIFKIYIRIIKYTYRHMYV